MTAAALLDRLRLRGLTLSVDGPEIVVRPASALTDEERTALRSQRDEVLALLLGTAIHRDKPPHCCHGCHSDTWWRALREEPTMELRRRHGGEAWQRTAIRGWICTACYRPYPRMETDQWHEGLGPAVANSVGFEL